MDILKKDVKQSIVDGLFYPDNPEDLLQRVKPLLDPQTLESQNCSTLMIPHGDWNYIFDGLIAALKASYNKSYKKIVIIGPVHREKDNDQIFLPSKKYLKTPLGFLKSDLPLLKELNKNSPSFTFNDSPHLEEHSIEVILPLIHYLYPEAKIIPLLTGNLKNKTIKNAGKVLNEIVYKENGVLTIISGNLSAFTSLEHSKKEAQKVFDLLKSSNIREARKQRKYESCSIVPLAILGELRPLSSYKKLWSNCSEVEGLNNEEKKGVFYSALSWNDEE